MRVYKYELPLGELVEIQMLKGATVLHLGVQGDVPCIWAMVDSYQAVETRRFCVAGTGMPIAATGPYLGTVMLYDGGLVLHVFEVTT